MSRYPEAQIPQPHATHEQLPPVKMPVSQAIFQKALWRSLAATVLLALACAAVGYAVDAQKGLLAGLFGALIGGVFMALSLVSILIANRQIANPLYVQLFFAIVLGALLLKMVVFLAIVYFAKDAAWLNTKILFISILAGVVLSLVLDLLMFARTRILTVSDAKLFE